MPYRNYHHRRHFKRRYKNYRKKLFKKKLRSRHQVARIAQAVVNHNLETKIMDQYAMNYPVTDCNHNVWTELFDNLTLTKQGISNEPGTIFAANRLGSSISPIKLWIKGLIQINVQTTGGNPVGYPITRVLVRFLVVRRNITETALPPAVPTGSPNNINQDGQAGQTANPCQFLSNIDQRQCTVVYDKIHGIQVGALTQSMVAPAYAAAGNSISKTFDINLNIKKWTRGKVDYSFRPSNNPPGLSVPKKYAFQLWCCPWINSGYDPGNAYNVKACGIIAQSRLYFKDA